MFTNPGDGAGLPLTEALGRVDAQHIHTGFHQSGHTLGVVAGVDAGAHHIALVGVQQFVDVFLVGIVVLAEDHVLQMAFLIHQGQGVDLVVPDDIVAIMQAGGGRRGDQLVQRSHELGDLQVVGHAGETIIAGSHNTQQLAMGGAVIGDGHGGVSGAGLEVQHIAEGCLRRQVGVGSDKSLLVGFNTAHHIRFLLNGLGTIDKGNTALLGQRNRQLFAGDRLHDGRHHRDIHFQRALFFPLAVFDQRGFQADSHRHTFRRRIAGDEQILTKGTGRFGKIIRHKCTLLTSCYNDRHQSGHGLYVIRKIVPHSRTKHKRFHENLSCTGRNKVVEFAPNPVKKV